MSRQHTPEPWHVYDSNKICDAKDERVAVIVHEDAEAAYVDGRDEVNAARIVECVNACNGVKSPGLAILTARAALAWFADNANRLGLSQERTRALDALRALGGVK
jgi:hypothetical protein